MSSKEARPGGYPARWDGIPWATRMRISLSAYKRSGVRWEIAWDESLRAIPPDDPKCDGKSVAFAKRWFREAFHNHDVGRPPVRSSLALLLDRLYLDATEDAPRRGSHGHRALNSAMDGTLTVARESPRPVAPVTVRFVKPDPRPVPKGSQTARYRQSHRLSNRVLGELERVGRATCYDLADTLKVSWQGVNASLTLAERRGQVARVEGKGQRRSPKGRDLIIWAPVAKEAA